MIMIPELGLGVFISTNTSLGGGKVMNGFVRELVIRFFPPGPDYIELPAQHIDASPDVFGDYILSRRAHTTVEKLAFPVAHVTRASTGDLLIGGRGHRGLPRTPRAVQKPGRIAGGTRHSSQLV